MELRGLTPDDLKSLLLMCDRWIGRGYFTMPDLEAYATLPEDKNPSLLLFDEEKKIIAFRLTALPGTWAHRFEARHLSQDLWSFALAEAGYFQSLFVAPHRRGQGLGGTLACESLVRLQNLGARGVVTHAWRESPHQSSVRYLKKVGFEEVCEHPLFWHSKSYDCSGCRKKPCTCSAMEMILSLRGYNT